MHIDRCGERVSVTNLALRTVCQFEGGGFVVAQTHTNWNALMFHADTPMTNIKRRHPPKNKQLHGPFSASANIKIRRENFMFLFWFWEELRLQDGAGKKIYVWYIHIRYTCNWVSEGEVMLSKTTSQLRRGTKGGQVNVRFPVGLFSSAALRRLCLCKNSIFFHTDTPLAELLQGGDPNLLVGLRDVAHEQNESGKLFTHIMRYVCAEGKPTMSLGHTHMGL